MPSVKMRSVMAPQVVDDLGGDHRTCRKSRKYLYAQSSSRFRMRFHIHLAEYLGEEFHAMVIIDCEEFVVIFLADFMGDDLPVDDSCHFVFALCRGGVYGNLADLDLPAVPLFPIPALVFVEQENIPSIDGSRRPIRHFLPELAFQRGKDFLLLLLTLRQFFLYFGYRASEMRCLLLRVSAVTLSAKSAPIIPFRISSRFSTGCSSMELEVSTATFSSVRS